jgi:hypothetical protein
MTTNDYTINRRVNAPIEFRGLKAQYILYAGALLTGDLLLFSILYVSGLPSWICVLTAAGLGGFGILRIYRFNNKYGQFGFLKKRAAKKIPKSVRSHSRRPFTQLKTFPKSNTHAKDTKPIVAHTRDQR